MKQLGPFLNFSRVVLFASAVDCATESECTPFASLAHDGVASLAPLCFPRCDLTAPNRAASVCCSAAGGMEKKKEAAGPVPSAPSLTTLNMSSM